MGWVAGVSIRTRMLSRALLAVMTIAPAWAAPLFLDAGSSLPGGIRVEARQAILNSESVRKANGRGLHDVIRYTVMLLLSPSGPLSMQYGSRCWINPIRRAVHWALLDWP